jgi:hypothetical protein
MPVTGIWDGSQWLPIQGLQGPTGAAGSDGADGATGPQGDQGPPGPSSVSTDAGNQSVLGSDSLIFTPDFASGTYLPLAGGTMTGDIQMGQRSIFNVAQIAGQSSGVLLLNGDGASSQVSLAVNLVNKLRVTSDAVNILTTLDMQDNAIYLQFGNENIGSLNFWDGNVIRGGMYATATGPRIFSDPTNVTQWDLAVTNSNILVNRNSVAQFVLTSASLSVPVIYGQQTSAVPNVYVTTGGTLQRSFNVIAGMTTGNEVALSARTGLSLYEGVDLEGIDLALLTNYILDRIDALEALH